MNKGSFINALILLLWIILIDVLIFTFLFNIHLQLAEIARQKTYFPPNAVKNFDFSALINPIGIFFMSILYLGIKILYGYYPAILAYFYIRKISATNFTPHKIILPLFSIFLISVLLALAFFEGDRPFSVDIAYKTPLGGQLYIALFASLVAPFIVKIILTKK